MRRRIGIDVGGTFTDAALVVSQTGQVRVFNVLATPEDPAKGFLPSIGTLELLQFGEAEGGRIDTGVSKPTD